MSVLNEGQQKEYVQIQAAMKAYAEDLGSAQQLYFKAFEQLFEQKASHVPWNVDNIPATMPTLSKEEKQAVSRAAMLVRRSSYTKMNEALKAAGIERPKGRDMEAWQTYNKAAATKRQEVMAEIEPKVEEAITKALSADMRPLFKTLLDAKEKSREMQSGAVEKYNAELEKIIGAERAKPKYYRGFQGGKPRIQNRGGKGGVAPQKKPLSEI